MDLEWGRYIVEATDPPPEEEEYPGVYVPVPLDAKGAPVTRYIRVIGGGGLDKDEVGCPPEEPKPLGGNVTWEVEIMEKTTSDFNAEELTHGTLDTLDPDDEIPYLLLESTGLGTAKVTVTAPEGDDRSGATIFHFIKLCCVDEDEEVVWLAADAGSYLLNEVKNGESEIGLVAPMAFRFYYDGPKMDEERSIDLTGGDGTEHTLDFSAGANTTEYRVIVYEDTEEDLAAASDSWFQGENIELVHNQENGLSYLDYDLLTGDVVISSKTAAQRWLSVCYLLAKFEYQSPGPARCNVVKDIASTDGTFSFWVDNPVIVSGIVSEPGFYYEQAFFSPINFEVQANLWVEGIKNGHELQDRLRWYQVMQGVCNVKLRNKKLEKHVSPRLADSHFPGCHSHDYDGNRVTDVANYRDKGHHNRFTSDADGRIAFETGEVFYGIYFSDRPGFVMYSKTGTPLEWCEMEDFFDLYLVIVKPELPTGGKHVGVRVVNAIVKVPWEVKDYKLTVAQNGDPYLSPPLFVRAQAGPISYDLPGMPEQVREAELFDVWEKVGDKGYVLKVDLDKTPPATVWWEEELRSLYDLLK